MANREELGMNGGFINISKSFSGIKSRKGTIANDGLIIIRQPVECQLRPHRERPHQHAHVTRSNLRMIMGTTAGRTLPSKPSIAWPHVPVMVSGG